MTGGKRSGLPFLALAALCLALGLAGFALYWILDDRPLVPLVAGHLLTLVSLPLTKGWFAAIDRAKAEGQAVQGGKA